MKLTRLAGIALFLLSCVAWAGAQSSKQTEKPTIGKVLDHSVGSVESEFVPAADAMPEDKYSFAPTEGEFKGVRTFAEQVKHVAAVNYLIASNDSGRKTAS